MLSELRRASGYLFIFVSPALLVLGMWLHIPALPFIFLIVIAPALRALFGDADRQPAWSEPVAAILELLPPLAACSILGALVATLWMLRRADLSTGDLIQLGASLWAVCIFASCVAHELTHRRSERSRLLGRLLGGAMGYPLAEHEHRMHHRKGGDVAGAEWPAISESVWRFTARRSARVLFTAWESDRLQAAVRGHRLAGGLPLACVVTVASAIGFYLAGGAAGCLLYLVVALVVSWTLQAITYVQHWGLGDDGVASAGVGYAWEDRCQLQAWLTLSISYHQAHHRHAAIPYYRVDAMTGSPRQPAGYVILLFACLVPRIWRALMLPVLEEWKRSPHTHRSAGRRLICFAKDEA